MAENTQRSTGRSQEYKFDRGGMPAEMGPYVGIVVNNVDNTRQGRLQVWIEQFGSTGPDGGPNLTDETTWRTVRYCSPFYGSTKQSGNSGVGSYPGNRNSYGMWFTPPDLGTKVLCFFVGGDPTIGGYYIGCLPEDGLNHMIPAIGASSNYQSNNSTQQQFLNGATSAPVTEINDIDPKITDNPRFFDQKKPVQSTVEGVLIQQGLNKDPIRGPIKSSSQRESPSNCYGISTPGKPIYQGGYSDKTLTAAIEKGQVKLQDIAVIGRQGGHTFVMDDGDINGSDTLVRIRTAKGHQITMSDDGDCFYITHANGQTWLEFGKQGTVDVFSTNSINMRTQGILNFHADQGINMYSGGTIRMKSKKTTLIEAGESLLMGSEKYTLLSGKSSVGIRSDGTLGLQGKTSTWKSDSILNFSAKLINLNGSQTIPVASMPNPPTYSLADVAFVANQGWTVDPGKLETIVTRAPTHEPYPYHNQATTSKVDLNPVIPDTPNLNSTQAKRFDEVSATPIQRGVTAGEILAEPTAATTLGSLSQDQVTALTAQTAANQSLKYPAYDDDGNLMPGYELNENNDAVYTGPELAIRGIGVYGQSPSALTSIGLLKSSALDLINNGVSVDSVLKSSASWTDKLGIGNLSDYLNSKTIQNIAQVGLAFAAFKGLVDSGTITGKEDPTYVATFVQPATQYGVDEVVSWADGFSPDSETTENIVISARQGQYAVDYVDAFAAELNTTTDAPVSELTTESTSRNVIDQEIANSIGDPKVPVPQYTDVEVFATDNTESTAAAIAAINANSTEPVKIETIIRPDGTIVKIAVTQSTTKDESTFRFSPGSQQG
jgi:hypothetical protein